MRFCNTDQEGTRIMTKDYKHLEVVVGIIWRENSFLWKLLQQCDPPGLWPSASRDSAPMSSVTPCGKLGAEPTKSTVLGLISRATAPTSTWYDGDGQATRWQRMEKYDAAFKKAACAVSGMILFFWLGFCFGSPIIGEREGKKTVPQV